MLLLAFPPGASPDRRDVLPRAKETQETQHLEQEKTRGSDYKGHHGVVRTAMQESTQKFRSLVCGTTPVPNAINNLLVMLEEKKFQILLFDESFLFKRIYS